MSCLIRKVIHLHSLYYSFIRGYSIPIYAKTGARSRIVFRFSKVRTYQADIQILSKEIHGAYGTREPFT